MTLRSFATVRGQHLIGVTRRGGQFVSAPQIVRCMSQTTSEAAAPPSAAVAPVTKTGPKGDQAAFPWRSAPGIKRSLIDEAWQFVKNIVPQMWVKRHFMREMCNLWQVNSPDDVYDLLLRCSRFAFIQAVRCITDGNAKVPPPTWDYTLGEQALSDKHDLEYPQLSDIMDSKLAEFYAGAYERLKARKCSVRLEVHSVEPVDIGDYRVLVGPPRGTVPGPGVYKLETANWASVMRQVEDEGGLMNEGFVEYWSRRLAPDSRMHFQVVVTLKVKELFLVLEEESQQVLQGQDAVVNSVHRVRLEVAFGKKGNLRRDWQIIDIDEWLGGNAYFPELPGPPEGEE